MRLCNYSLTPTRISSAKSRSRLYKLTDGGGLFVEVSAAGLKTWRYQYRFGGSRREITIGKFPEVGVADARERHFEMRAMLERGIDPLDARRQQESARRERSAEVRAAGDDFESFSRRWIRERLVTKSEIRAKGEAGHGCWPSPTSRAEGGCFIATLSFGEGWQTKTLRCFRVAVLRRRRGRRSNVCHFHRAGPRICPVLEAFPCALRMRAMIVRAGRSDAEVVVERGVTSQSSPSHWPDTGRAYGTT